MKKTNYILTRNDYIDLIKAVLALRLTERSYTFFSNGADFSTTCAGWLLYLDDILLRAMGVEGDFYGADDDSFAELKEVFEPFVGEYLDADSVSPEWLPEKILVALQEKYQFTVE